MTPPIRTPADAVAFLRQLAGSPDGSITHAALANAANALEAAIAATPPASPWQPIDTAPRDGSRILLYDRGVIVEGYYVGAPCFWVIVDRYDDSCLPTHWMPLPEPPVKGDS